MCFNIRYLLFNFLDIAADVAQREKYPGETTPGYVVISFNISDRKMVGMIRNRLKSAGYRVWLDTTEIEQLSGELVQNWLD